MDHVEIMRQVYEEAQRGVLCMWTIYDKPTDFPTTFVARRHDVGKGGKPYPAEHAITGDLSKLRTLFLQAGLTCISRHEQDEPQIVEVWL